MLLDATAPRTRRAILAAALGAAAATVASALGRPLPVTAANGDYVRVGDSFTGSGPTTLTNTVTDPGSILVADAIRGVSTIGSGVYGRSTSNNGVYGRSTSGCGVLGVSSASAGVTGTSTDSLGIIGATQNGTKGGILGMSIGDGTGLAGHTYSGSPGGEIPDAPAKTGVYGAAHQAGGVGGYFTCASDGTALKVVGKATFDRAGRLKIAAGRSEAIKTLAGVTTSSVVVATMQTHRTGNYVAAVVPHAGYFTIHLGKALTANTYVSYFVLN